MPPFTVCCCQLAWEVIHESLGNGASTPSLTRVEIPPSPSATSGAFPDDISVEKYVFRSWPPWFSRVTFTCGYFCSNRCTCWFQNDWVSVGVTLTRTLIVPLVTAPALAGAL